MDKKHIIFLTSEWPIHASIFCASVDTSAGALTQHTCCEGMPFWQIKNAGLNFDRFQASTPVEKYTKLPKLNNQQCFLQERKLQDFVKKIVRQFSIRIFLKMSSKLFSKDAQKSGETIKKFSRQFGKLLSTIKKPTRQNPSTSIHNPCINTTTGVLVSRCAACSL